MPAAITQKNKIFIKNLVNNKIQKEPINIMPMSCTWYWEVHYLYLPMG